VRHTGESLPCKNSVELGEFVLVEGLYKLGPVKLTSLTPPRATDGVVEYDLTRKNWTRYVAG
jgi:hypothetical protein